VKRKILLVTKSFFPDSKGGVEESVRQIINKCSNNSITFDVLTLSNETREYFYEEIKVLTFKKSFNFQSNPISFDLIGNLKIVKDYDLIHIHSPWPFFELLSIFLPKRKILITYHCGIYKFPFSNFIYKFFMKLILLRVKKFIFTSKRSLLSFNAPNFLKNKCTVVSLWFDDKRMLSGSSFEEEKNYEPYQPYAIFIGSLRWYKGLNFLLDAFHEIDNLNLLIVGTGPKEKFINAELKNSKSKNIKYLGSLSDEITLNYLKNSKFLILPSTSPAEAFGQVLLEASYFKKPMITTELGTGTSYVNKNLETGIVIKPNSKIELVKAIKELIGDKDKIEKYGNNAYNRLHKEFSADFNSKKLLEVYSKFNHENSSS